MGSNKDYFDLTLLDNALMDMMGYAMCRKVLHVYVRNVYLFLCLHMNLNFELEQAYHSFSDELSLHSNSICFKFSY